MENNLINDNIIENDIMDENSYAEYTYEKYLNEEFSELKVQEMFDNSILYIKDFTKLSDELYEYFNSYYTDDNTLVIENDILRKKAHKFCVQYNCLKNVELHQAQVQDAYYSIVQNFSLEREYCRLIARTINVFLAVNEMNNTLENKLESGYLYTELKSGFKKIESYPISNEINKVNIESLNIENDIVNTMINNRGNISDNKYFSTPINDLYTKRKKNVDDLATVYLSVKLYMDYLYNKVKYHEVDAFIKLNKYLTNNSRESLLSDDYSNYYDFDKLIDIDVAIYSYLDELIKLLFLIKGFDVTIDERFNEYNVQDADKLVTVKNIIEENIRKSMVKK